MNNYKTLELLESLTTIMQESAEHGEIDGAVYAPVLQFMGELITSLKNGVSVHE